MLLAFTLAVLYGRGFAGFKYSHQGCPDVTDADFKATLLFSHANGAATSEPLKMAFDMDDKGNTDIYFVQRTGQLRRYNAATKTLTELATLPVTTPSSDGLNGIALDPGFKSNRWIYLFYTVSDLKVWRISRFKLAGDKLDPASEKIILVIPTKGSSQHPGGGMQFDDQGNLWFGSGENSMITGGGAPASNTNDLRGKILRFKPKPIPDATVLAGSGVGITYDIPAGNLFPPGTAKTLPEIYVMGVRNPYSLTLDPVRKGVAWGDVGPDGNPNPTEEHDFTTKPMNGGWPFFAGNNTSLGGGGTADKPTNTSAQNTGLIDLPPVTPGMHSYKEDCAITGPVYYSNNMSPFRGKLPPHFDGKWFVTDYNNSMVEILTLDEKGQKIIKEDTAFTNLLRGLIKNPLDFQAGPDGALYIDNYAGNRSVPVNPNTGIIKIEYTGSCVTVGNTRRQVEMEKARLGFAMDGQRIVLSRTGNYAIEVSALSGRVIARQAGQGPAQYDLRQIRKPGVYLIRVTTAQGKLTSKFVRK